MVIYFLPTSEDALQDRVFKPDTHEYKGGLSSLPIWVLLYNAAKKEGVNMHTYDFWSREKSRSDDVLLVQDHPGATFLWKAFYWLKRPKRRGGFFLEKQRFFWRNYKLFSKRILIQGESPAVMPYGYNKRAIALFRSSRVYTKTFFHSQDWGHGAFHYYFYRNENIISPYFDDPKDKFLTMVNGNQLLHSFKKELYGERLKAIKYFSASPGFDLYGRGWGKRPRHPLYFHYKKYVSRAWRGSVSDKLKAISQYKFALCFENCVYPGYVSEKIFDCLAAGSIPIYFGAPDIDLLVPKNCFIDFREFNNYDELNQFLSSMPQERIRDYQGRIKSFLADESNMRDFASFVKQLIA